MLPPRLLQLQMRPHLSPTHPLVQPSTHRPAPPTNTCTPYHSKLAVLPRLNILLMLFLARFTDLDYPRPLRSPHLNLILRSFFHSPLLYSLPSNNATRSCPSLCPTVRPQVTNADCSWLQPTSYLIVRLHCLTMSRLLRCLPMYTATNHLTIFHCRGGIQVSRGDQTPNKGKGSKPK